METTFHWINCILKITGAWIRINLQIHFVVEWLSGWDVFLQHKRSPNRIIVIPWLFSSVMSGTSFQENSIDITVFNRRINGLARPVRFGVHYNARLWEICIFFHFFGNISPKLLLLSDNMPDLIYLHHISSKTAFNYIKFLWKLDLLSLILVYMLICFDEIIISSHQNSSQC